MFFYIHVPKLKLKALIELVNFNVFSCQKKENHLLVWLLFYNAFKIRS